MSNQNPPRRHKVNLPDGRRDHPLGDEDTKFSNKEDMAIFGSRLRSCVFAMNQRMSLENIENILFVPSVVKGYNHEF